MKISVSKEGENTVIAPEGEINTNTAKEFQDAIEESGSKNLIFDFSEVMYITSAALRVILATQQRIDREDGSLLVRKINKVISEIFDETGFDDIIMIEQ